MIDVVYATPDGEWTHRKQYSATLARRRGVETTAAATVDRSPLEAVTDEETRDRYRTEVERVRGRYDPDAEL
ncbi:hypothetical protein [Halogeometricum limi]|uniref:DUF7967 domain-containing protein n=1 Tax=Halogeometricum limi TaxID=555875 RepID=A0A1I6FQN9_9EURY|nr:hypothetical protein [Halogeometricum limi]SFR32270.1 hypothetical protein SAMN04488124_0091 [Halogeometricum limi]